MHHCKIYWKYSLLFSFLLFKQVPLFAQSDTYDLLKYKIPADWQQQSRSQWVSYSGADKETNISLEIIVHKSQPAAPKIDSSFKVEWKRILDSNYGDPVIPLAKKRYTPSSIQYAENGGEVLRSKQKIYSQLFVFIIDKQLQTIQVITDSPASYKSLRPFMDGFLETVDTVIKRE